MAEVEGDFTDGAAYERSTGQWSRAVGNIFLDWLSLPNDLRWLDVGHRTDHFVDFRIRAQSRCAERRSITSGARP